MDAGQDRRAGGQRAHRHAAQQGQARLLQARIDLAREIHERVVQRLFGISLALGSEHGLSDEARRRCADEMQAALGGPARRAVAAARSARVIDTGATLRAELERLGRPTGGPAAGGRLGRGHGVAARARAARAVRARRGAAQRAQARAAHLGATWTCRPARTPSRSRSATTARVRSTARHGHGAAAGGGGGAPARRRRGVRARARRTGGCGWWCPASRRLTSDESRAQPARAGGGRPRRGALGLPAAAAEQPWVERCLAAPSSEEALELARRYEPHVALVDLFLGEESGAELCEAIRRESPAHARAADLRRRLDLAPGGAARPAHRASCRRTGRRHDVADGGARWWAKGMTVFAPAPGAALGGALGARARGARR